jgi:hypothetical protein
VRSVIDSEFAAAENLVTGLYDDLRDALKALFGDNGTSSIGDILAHLGSNLLSTTITAMKSIVHGLTKVFAKLVTYFRALLDAK